MNLSETRKGEIFVLTTSLLSGLFPVIALLSFKSLEPILSLAWSTMFASIFFAVLLTVNKKWHEFLRKDIIPDLLAVVLIIGIINYGLFYTGIKLTSPGNVSIIGLTEIFFSFLLFNVWKKESISGSQIAGIAFVALGALIVILPEKGISFNPGDLMILAVNFIAPIGNYFQRRARKKVSSLNIMFARSIITFPIMFILARALSYNISFGEAKEAFWFLAITGILILGLSKILWIEAIHRISVTKTAALNSIYPIFTLIFAFLLLNQTPTLRQIIALLPIAFGVYLLTKQAPPTVGFEQV